MVFTALPAPIIRLRVQVNSIGLYFHPEKNEDWEQGIQAHSVDLQKADQNKRKCLSPIPPSKGCSISGKFKAWVEHMMSIQILGGLQESGTAKRRISAE